MRDGWNTRKLGDICTIKNGRGQKAVENPNGQYPIYGSGGIMGYADDYICEAGTTIIGRKGTINKPIFVDCAFWNVDTAFGLQPNTSTNPRFLFLLCKSIDFTRYNKSTTLPSLVKSDLLKIDVQVPPIAEQEKIVAELDCLTGIVEKKKQQLEELDNLAQSIFYDMFGSREYQKEQLISLCADKDDIKCGPFGTQLSKSEFLKDGVPVWGIPQVNSNFAISPTDFVSEEKALALQSFSIIGGDIVMSRKGNIGQSAIYPTSFESGILHSDVLRIRVKRELANPLFLVYQFHQSAEIKHQFKIIGYGAIMPGLNVSKLKNVIVNIPPITLQNEFAQKVEAIEKQKELVKQSIVETETLFNSRMDYWFN